MAQVMSLIDQIADATHLSQATLTDLEPIRVSLQTLVWHLDPETRPTIYTDFRYEISGPEILYELLPGYVSSEAYRDKMERIIRQNLNHLTIRRLHNNQPIIEAKLNELERMLFSETGIETKEQFTRALGDKSLLESCL